MVTCRHLGGNNRVLVDLDLSRRSWVKLGSGHELALSKAKAHVARWLDYTRYGNHHVDS